MWLIAVHRLVKIGKAAEMLGTTPSTLRNWSASMAALEAFCAAKGWECEVIGDLGSGLNYRKKGLQRLLKMILRREMSRLVLTHQDRLGRFGSELVFGLCEDQGIEVVSSIKESSRASSRS